MYIEDMRDELAEYYEAAGFENYYDRVLKHKTNDEIIEMYKDAFGENEVQDEEFE